MNLTVSTMKKKTLIIGKPIIIRLYYYAAVLKQKDTYTIKCGTTGCRSKQREALLVN